MNLSELTTIIDSKVYEAGKTPLNIEWNKSKKKWIGSFKLDSITFEILIKVTDYCDIDTWEFKFTRANSTKMINDYKYPFQIVPTIQSAMSQFLKEMKPDVIGFVGNKDDKGRVKLYEKNAKIYSDKFNYKLVLDKQTDYYAFILYKTDEFKDCLDILNSKQ